MTNGHQDHISHIKYAHMKIPDLIRRAQARSVSSQVQPCEPRCSKVDPYWAMYNETFHKGGQANINMEHKSKQMHTGGELLFRIVEM
jgi:hypothetical protein